MSEEDALLAAVYADPDDDTPRLVYADWLDEHGRPERAEFIRVQVELSHLTDDDPRERPLRDRRWELWYAHREQWAAEIGIVESDAIKTEFRRGFIDELNLYDDVPGGVDLVCRVPGVRRVSLWRVALTSDAVRVLAALDLDSLTIYETSFPREWLELLEPLPCGTVLRITPKDDEPFPPGAWYEFQSRRICELAHLSPAARYAEARRWLRGHDERNGYTHGPKAAVIEGVKVCDLEMILLSKLKEIEDVRVNECDLSAIGLGFIAQLPHLKALHVFWAPVDSISPLACCTTLEKLWIVPEYGTSIGAPGTEGLERLVNLRELTLRVHGGDGTLVRIGALRKLTSLDIELRSVASAESYAALSHLAVLENLHLDSDLPGGALPFLAPCRNLRTIKIRVPTGTPDDFVALGVLTEVREMHIKGGAVTDAAIRHFAPLKKLHALMGQGTAITHNGARWLADQLPEVTIILNDFVAKSRRLAITFSRRLAEDGAASALVPTHWHGHWGRSTAELCQPLVEDGCESVRDANFGVVGPAEIRLHHRAETSPEAVLNDLVARSTPDYKPNIDERDVVEPVGAGTSGVYSAGRDRTLVVVTASEGACAVLSCGAPVSRFEEFRPLFMFVARSLRVGPAALESVGEEVTVPVSQL